MFSSSRHRLIAFGSLAGYLAAMVAAICLHDHSQHSQAWLASASAGSWHASDHQDSGHHHSDHHVHSGHHVAVPSQHDSDHDGHKHPAGIPCSDDDCVICQFLASKLLSAPKQAAVICVADSSEFVRPIESHRPTSIPVGVPQSRAPPAVC